MRPYSAAPLTDDQRREALRAMSETAAAERSNYRTMLEGERHHALRAAKDEADPARKAERLAVAAAYERALELLGACWPVPDLAPQAVA